ncbi:MAG TPA: hypothetical protein P5232_02940 [Candidatus Moranbacteria bacterium]|nr:hypothetical protein [Candidatus Moranbacteria bacterium]
MPIFNFPTKKNISILALGAESAGNFSVFNKGKIYFSEDFGDLLEEKNWKKFQSAVLKYLKDNKIKPEIILTDLHPLFKTTLWGKELAKKYGAKHIPVQHHISHTFSSVGDSFLKTPGVLSFRHRVSKTFYGIALDGTGFGTDEKIWGGEVFKGKMSARQKGLSVERIGHLENQIMIGGDLAIKEPARMLISILNKFLSKKEIYSFVKKYYTQNEFELIYNQLAQNFNCLETSSAGRVLDAVSILLGFCGNARKYKHEPIDKLEKNSTKPYTDLRPKIDNNCELQITYLFNYLINYLHKRDRKRLAATAQLYIAQGLYKIIELARHPDPPTGGEGSAYKNLKLNNCRKTKSITKQILHSTSLVQNDDVFISGGLTNNKIISSFLESKGAYINKKIPRGDAGISFGQLVYYLSS